jgi:hypothetical protein
VVAAAPMPVAARAADASPLFHECVRGGMRHQAQRSHSARTSRSRGSRSRPDRPTFPSSTAAGRPTSPRTPTSTSLQRSVLPESRRCSALLLGRVTYEAMVAAWPNMEGELADTLNALPKFVVSSTLETTSWNATALGPTGWTASAGYDSSSTATSSRMAAADSQPRSSSTASSTRSDRPSTP